MTMLNPTEAEAAQPAQVQMVDCWGERIVRQFATRLQAEAFVAIIPEAQTQRPPLHLLGVNLGLVREARIMPVLEGSN